MGKQVGTIPIEEAQKILELNYKEALLLGTINGAVKALSELRTERQGRWDKIIKEQGLDPRAEHGFTLSRDIQVPLEIRREGAEDGKKG